MRSKPHKVVNFFFGTTFIAILNIITIIGFVFLFFSNKEQALIALIAFVVFLLVLLIRVFWVTDQFLKNKSEYGYEKLSTSAKYYTRDGNIIIYELKKFIQCKQILMDKHEHKFFWTGTSSPIISSETMKYEKIIDAENGYKTAVFKIPNPLIYNSVFVAHIKMEIDDSNRASQTHTEQYVREKTQLISFKVQLLYKKGNNIPDAVLSRRPVDSPNLQFETIKAIPFDRKISSYEYNLFEPEVGYSYRLSWQR